MLHMKNMKLVLNINNLGILNGTLPPRVYSLVVEWAMLHQDQLINNWDKARNLHPIIKIKPLV